MANPYKGEHIVKMNDKDYVLKYDLNSLAELQERLGVESFEGILEAFQKMEFKTVRMLLWAGILHNHVDEYERPTVTEREVGSWNINLMDVAETIGKALTKAMGVDEQALEELEKKEQQAQKKAVATKGKGTKKKT